MREILIKTVFLSNVSHIQLNYAFLLWNIFGKIHRELLFLVQKWQSQKGALKYSESLFSLTYFKKGQILRKIWICLKYFFDQTSKMGEILTKTCYSPKTMLFCCFEAFMGISQRTCLFSQKSDILRKEHRNTQKVCFS